MRFNSNSNSSLLANGRGVAAVLLGAISGLRLLTKACCRE
jgi:hypothetical protein